MNDAVLMATMAAPHAVAPRPRGGARLPSAWVLMLALASGAGAAPAPPPADAVLETIVAKVLADARQRAPSPTAEVRLVSSQAVNWRDGAMGCAIPGVNYTQALVPGWQIVVQVGDQTLDYHANRRGGWVWCPPGRATAPAPDDRI